MAADLSEIPLRSGALFRREAMDGVRGVPDLREYQAKEAAIADKSQGEIAPRFRAFA